MGVMFGLSARVVTVSRVLVWMGSAALAACGGDHRVSPAAYNTDAALSEAVKAGTLTIQTTPALTPGFDATIHDYVINCTSVAQVQLAAQLGGANYFGFFGPGNASSTVGALPTGQFQQSFALGAGQRFRFRISLNPNEYSVRCLPSDFPPITVATAGVREAQWYVFAPTLFFTTPAIKPSSYVIVADANGTPVWWKTESIGPAIDAKVLGPNEIAWTFQTNEPDGQYFIHDFSGNLLNTIGSNLNDHDLQPTPNGTFLAIHDVTRICPPDCADMSPWGGSPQTAALDQEIVELDQQSNVIWSWRTRDHITLAETGLAGFFPAVGPDIIHMNSVEPDGTDAVIFSARHLSAIYHITKSTGAIDWKLGGVNIAQSLTVVGDTRPTALGPNGITVSGQHDARLSPDGTISLHDNGTLADRPPAIVRYQVDTASKTATVVEQIQDKLDPGSICCGSARRLPGGHWLAQWGGQPYMTELDASGNPVLTISYNLGSIFSYRAIPVLPGVIDADTLRDGMDAMGLSK